MRGLLLLSLLAAAPNEPSGDPAAPAEPPTEAPVETPVEAAGETAGETVADTSTDDVERAPETLLVLPLVPRGLSVEKAGTATAHLVGVVAGLARLTVLSTEDVDELVEFERVRTAMGGSLERGFAEISRLANARLVMSGSIGRVGTEIVISLNLVDAAAAVSVARGTRSVPREDLVFGAIDELVAEVVGAADLRRDRAARFDLGRAETSFAVFDLKPLGISKDAAKNLTQVLAVEIKNAEGATVVSRDDIASMLELASAKERLQCEDDVGCLTQIGGALGVDKLIVGHAGRLGESFVISLRLIDVVETNVDNRVNETFSGLEDQLLPAVRFAGRALLGVEETGVGTLALTGTPSGARVTVDGEVVGIFPIPPLTDMPPGRHALRISADGHADWRTDVYVDGDRVTALWAQLSPLEDRWYQKWWVWTMAGGVVAGGVAAAVIAAQPGDATLVVSGPRPGNPP